MASRNNPYNHSKSSTRIFYPVWDSKEKKEKNRYVQLDWCGAIVDPDDRRVVVNEYWEARDIERGMVFTIMAALFETNEMIVIDARYDYASRTIRVVSQVN